MAEMALPTRHESSGRRWSFGPAGIRYLPWLLLAAGRNMGLLAASLRGAGGVVSWLFWWPPGCCVLCFGWYSSCLRIYCILAQHAYICQTHTYASLVKQEPAGLDLGLTDR
jgi:hypothetical protein